VLPPCTTAELIELALRSELFRRADKVPDENKSLLRQNRATQVIYPISPVELVGIAIMSTGSKPKELLAQLFREYRNGNPTAIGQLVECFYPELRRLAAIRMRHERAGHTWQSTILIHELYLELVRAKPPSDVAAKDEEAAFFGLAGHVMNRLLIH